MKYPIILTEFKCFAAWFPIQNLLFIVYCITSNFFNAILNQIKYKKSS